MNLHDLPRRQRWVSFDDSWSIADVTSAFDILQVTINDTVFDPFIGCGTTALVASARSIPIVGSDISPFAVLMARMKCDLKYDWDVTAIQEVFRQYTWQKIALAITHQHLHTLVEPKLFWPIIMCFVAATYRSGWLLDGEMSQICFQQALDTLLDEIQHDLVAMEQPQHRCELYCADFRDMHVLTSAIPSPVMISSPPFFGSRSNPLCQLLDRVLRPYMDITESEVHTYDAHDVRSMLFAQPYIADLLVHNKLEVNSYINMLCDISIMAHNFNCRAVMLEMGPALVDGNWIQFEYILSHLLADVGFNVKSVDRLDTVVEPVYRIHAVARRNNATE
jgi:hypothetical protein